MALALETKGSVHITAAGTPIFSREIASCTLHDEHEPQSPDAVITRSQVSLNSSRISVGHSREAFPLFLGTSAANS